MNRIVAGPLSRHGPFPDRLEPERIAAYAAATGDKTPSALDGQAVPTAFAVVLVFEAQQAANGDLPETAWRGLRCCFASPTPRGTDLAVNAYGIDGGSFAFEATCRDIRTITHGRLELRS